LGYREQLKPGGAIPEKGKKITLSVRNITDLSRDVIKVSFRFILFCTSSLSGGSIDISSYYSMYLKSS